MPAVEVVELRRGFKRERQLAGQRAVFLFYDMLFLLVVSPLIYIVYIENIAHTNLGL